VYTTLESSFPDILCKISVKVNPPITKHFPSLLFSKFLQNTYTSTSPITATTPFASASLVCIVNC
ncbi:hypothetical protein S83_038203, partial [Arachis hypogaea]